VRLYFRRVNQADAWQAVAMAEAEGEFRGAIPGDYTQTEFPLQYYFGLDKGFNGSVLYPGFDSSLANQPYFITRLRA
jgi:hypothetical protein